MSYWLCGSELLAIRFKELLALRVRVTGSVDQSYWLNSSLSYWLYGLELLALWFKELLAQWIRVTGSMDQS